MFVKEW